MTTINYHDSHIKYKSIMENDNFDIKNNLDILLNDNNLPPEEVLARYVIILISIRKDIMQDSTILSKSQFALKICHDYPFLSEISADKLFYVAQGQNIDPSDMVVSKN